MNESYAHGDHSIFFKRVFIASVIISIIAGFVMGMLFAEDTSSTETYSFDFAAAIITWLSCGAVSVDMYALYSHFDNQEVQINNLYEIRKALASSPKTSAPPPAKPANVSADASSVVKKSRGSRGRAYPEKDLSHVQGRKPLRRKAL